MTILITGANGFLGSALVERLIERGERELRCLVRAGSDRSRLEAVWQRHPEARGAPTVGSLMSTDAAARALDGVATVYHLAAALRGPAADVYLNTVVASAHLLEAAARQSPPPRLVLVSSFGVYDTASLPAGALLDESTPLEPHPAWRDPYSQAKLRQERLFWEYRERHGLTLVVLRPGVLYGPGSAGLSARVGLELAHRLLFLGGDNPLPLAYVDNCAEALAVAAASDAAVGEAFNVVDDDIPTCREFYLGYRLATGRGPGLAVPYPVLRAASVVTAWYHRVSRGQLPAVFTPYRTRTTWKPCRFTNAKLKGLGYRQPVSTSEGLRRTWAALSAPSGGAA